MRISDWSSDVCSSDLPSWRSGEHRRRRFERRLGERIGKEVRVEIGELLIEDVDDRAVLEIVLRRKKRGEQHRRGDVDARERLEQRARFERRFVEPEHRRRVRSAEHTSELQSLMRISYAVFCLNTQ